MTTTPSQSTKPSQPTKPHQSIADQAEHLGDVAVRNEHVAPWFDRLTRTGYAAKGVTYLLMGWLALLAAFSQGGSMTDQRGALQYLADQPFGVFLLGMVAVGLAGYALWYVARGIFDLDRKGTDAKGIAGRLLYLLVGGSYFGLALGAFRVAFSVGSAGDSSDTSTRDWTATIMQYEWGTAMIVVGGLVMLGVAGVQFYQAYTASFATHLDQYEMTATAREWVIRLGRIGLSARGLIFGIIGLFLIVAAMNRNPEEARGIGGALEALAAQPYGLLLAGVVGAGLVAYGAHSLAQARYLRLAQLK